MKKLLILFLLTSAALVTKAQEVDFTMKMPLNKPFKSVTNMKMDIEGEQSMIMDMVMKSTINVSKYESPNYTMENTTDAIKVDMDAGMMTISYDSEKPSDDPTAAIMAAQFEKLLGKKMTIITSDKGKMISMEGVEGTDSSFENFAMTTTYPDKPVKPGDTWTSESTNKGIKTKAINKYVGKTAEGYQVETTGEMFNDSDTKIGTMSSTYIADTETLFTKSATIKMQMDVEGQKVTSDITMTVLK
ncbi:MULTISPECIES: DUF6263 family protein [Sphingobacterium]|uniref:DUF6263 family protein n=1 Tax=Sphingobacterium TaxID=28453 RepID=UPI0016287855|nr:MULTISPECIES: DUF6263 family protein [Sphingobacterium]